MKSITIRNFVLSIDKKKAFYHGKEIILCGVSARPRHYWIDVLNKKTSTTEPLVLYMAEKIQIVQ